MKMTSFPLLFSCWIIAAIATLGSLFFSQIMEFTPCALCWYQRIAMYPLVIIFLIGALKAPESTFIFSAPFVFIGWFIALYHNLLHYEVIPESASPCLEGVSCSTVYIEWLGFITIPMLSLFAFTLIGLLLVSFKRMARNEK
ncbi:MAG: disulfide bond formation protein B [Bacteriovoracaceae bacterium]|nr:disulfide bond formation protein B [Bacteriovoracaceae bacterium]